MSIGNRLKYLLKLLGVNQENFAKKLKTNAGTVSNWIHDRKKISNSYLLFIEEKYHVNIEWLQTGKGDIFTPDIEQKQIDEMIQRNLDWVEKFGNDILKGKIKYTKAVKEKVKFIIQMQDRLFKELEELGIKVEDEDEK